MFSFIRDRYVELEFPCNVPDCQIWPTNQNNRESQKDSEKRKTKKSSELDIVHEIRPQSRRFPSESPQIIEKVDKYSYPVQKFLSNPTIEPEKSEYKQLKEIDRAKHVAPFSSDVAKLPDNKKFNRYINILPYDFNRIKLKDPVDGIDYINGSHITGSLSNENPQNNLDAEENAIKSFEFSKFRNINFLATQGPLQ